ncbi:MAG: glycerate kinase [Chitinophagaceae bacterium]|nr:glycerate kinase [Chitinophagaceae bacterium]
MCYKKQYIVVTGEGVFDKQSHNGKGAFVVAETAKKYKKKLIGIVGKKADEDQSDYFDLLIENAIDFSRNFTKVEITAIVTNNILRRSSNILKLA